MDKTVYNLDPVTGELLSQDPARESPREPGEFLKPANSTFEPPPPHVDGQARICIGDIWSYVPDVRGIWYGADQQPREALRLGANVEGLTRVAPPSPDHELVDGQWVESPALAAARLQALKPELVAGVDDAIDAIYRKYTRFETEYVQREAAARAFKTASYVGDAGVWVTAFSDSTGMTPTAATDVIIQQADQLRSALELLAVQRMRKYLILSATSVPAAQAVYDDIKAEAAAIAATL